MKAFRSISSLATGVGLLAFAIVPTAPLTVGAAQLNTAEIDLAIARAAKSVTVASTPAPAPVAKGVLSGGDADEDEDVECLVKFWEPQKLKSIDREDIVVLVQAKLICNDEIGDAELLIEENDLLVVADTVTNNQTHATLLSTTVKLSEEQHETFCVSVARETDNGDFHVVAQECWYDLGHYVHED